MASADTGVIGRDAASIAKTSTRPRQSHQFQNALGPSPTAGQLFFQKKKEKSRIRHHEQNFRREAPYHSVAPPRPDITLQHQTIYSATSWAIDRYHYHAVPLIFFIVLTKFRFPIAAAMRSLWQCLHARPLDQFLYSLQFLEAAEEEGGGIAVYQSLVGFLGGAAVGVDGGGEFSHGDDAVR
mmetsp:Transcript_23813/g.40716  ORF Transcript_23813/g.40716 Transcript_23813/m.40716 type:complete len:182 (+) Transcript_23813:640-1185(+)